MVLGPDDDPPQRHWELIHLCEVTLPEALVINRAVEKKVGPTTSALHWHWVLGASHVIAEFWVASA